MENKLQSLSERVDQLENTGGFEVQSISNQNSERTRRYYNIVKYNNLLKTDLLSNYTVNGVEYHFLNRFVPTDLSGEIMKVSDHLFGWADKRHNLPMYTQEYQDHLSKVMFEGFEVASWENNKKVLICRIPLMSGSTHFFNVFWHNEIDNWYLSKGVKSISDLVQLNINLTPYGAKTAGI